MIVKEVRRREGYKEGEGGRTRRKGEKEGV